MVDKAKSVTQSSFPIRNQHGLKENNFTDLRTSHIIKNKFRGIHIAQTNLSSRETITIISHPHRIFFFSVIKYFTTKKEFQVKF